MLAALVAHRRGRRVLLIDPMAHQRNNFAISGGLFPAAGSRLQQQAGIADSPQAWLADLQAYAGDTVNVHIRQAVADALPQVVDFLLDHCQAPIRFLPDMVAPGHQTLRFHSVTPASGASFHAWFRDQLRRTSAIQFSQSAPVVYYQGDHFELRLTEPGRKAPQQLRVPELLLAGGGFAADPAMVAEFIPSMAGALNNGSPTQDGSTIRLGRSWGGQLWGMNGYQGQGHTHPGGATRLGMSIPALGGIMVNQAGQRFVREDLGPSALAPHVLRQPGGVVLEVFDGAIEAQLANHSAYQEAVAAGRVLSADTVASLATLAGVPGDALGQTLADVTRLAKGPALDPLGRISFARSLCAPFKASWVTGALSHTQGGLLTDGQGRVLGQGGRPVPGLFAAGGAAAGLSGRGADGYLPGNGLAQAFGLAWQVAKSLR
jgi:fumarate reductase flavoprotein subunit